VQIVNIHSFKGKSIYSHKSVIRMDIDFGDLYAKPTKDIKNFNQLLLSLFPGLYKHYCSTGYEGGFVDRLKEGTYIGHVTEHLIIELQNQLGYDVGYGKTRVVKEPSLYYIVYEYMNEKCGIECGKAAVNIVSDIIKNETPDLESILEGLKRVVMESELGPSTRAIYDEARKRGIPVTRLGDESLLQLGYGKNLRLIEASLTDAASCISVDIAGNKYLTKQILADYKIPVPYGDVAYTEEIAVKIAEEIGYPVVVKPYNGNQGKGVNLNIQSEKQVREAFGESIKFGKAVVVENYIKGKDYRVLVVGSKVSAVSERMPPCVKGDGIHTVKELVDIENSNPLRGNDHEKPLTRIKIDGITALLLARKGIDENYVPSEGETVYLRDNTNLSTGGTAKDCTNDIHPYNRDLFIKAAKILGLDIAGIDVTMEDISVPLTGDNGALIEVNAAPGLRMHLYPSEGQKRNVANDILDMMFPDNKSGTIPIVSITGTNGKTTTTRLVRHTLALMGKKVGMTTTSGIYIGDECILKGDNTGPISARLVLSNREVEAAVLETARGGIIKNGLGYELADVGVVTNISDDHIGVDGISSAEELAFVKSLVIEAVKPDGYAVLNADDKMAEYLMKRARGNIILFSQEENNPLLEGHLKSGGKAVYVNEGIIYIYDQKPIPLMQLKDIPITYGGVVRCNIENSLAVVSAMYGLDVPVEIIEMGLKSFKPDEVLNPGRFNIFEMGSFKVMLDYGHNPAGYKAVIDFIKTIDAKRYIGVIGVPGDRMDESIREIGTDCSTVFSRVYIKEDDDLRGRRKGEVAGILYNQLMKEGMRKEAVKVILSESKAFEAAILDAQPEDLIVLFYQKFDEALNLINKFKSELENDLLEQKVFQANIINN
jgi:cyanophycin synthetase